MIGLVVMLLCALVVAACGLSVYKDIRPRPYWMSDGTFKLGVGLVCFYCVLFVGCLIVGLFALLS